MGNAITAAGTNNLLGIFGVQDALMHMFPDIHTAIGERMQLQDVVMPGKLELQVINVHQDYFMILSYIKRKIRQIVL